MTGDTHVVVATAPGDAGGSGGRARGWIHVCALLGNEVTYPRFTKGDTEAWGMTWKPHTEIAPL